METSAVAEYFSGAIGVVQTFPFDILVIAVVFIAFFGYALPYGKGGIVALIFSLYTALLLYSHFPYIERFLLFQDTEAQLFFSHVGIFMVFAIIAYVVLRRIVYGAFSNGTTIRLFEAGLLGAATTVLLLAILYQALPVAALYDFSEPVDLLFEPSYFFFLWLIAPLAAILLTTRG